MNPLQIAVNLRNPDTDETVSEDLMVSVDGQQVTTLADAGAIMSEEVADRLNNVKTPWTGPHIRMAG